MALDASVDEPSDLQILRLLFNRSVTIDAGQKLRACPLQRVDLQPGALQLYAFDILSLDGDDLRKLPLSMRQTNLDRLLARRPEGIFTAPFEQGEIGPDLFRTACDMGLEGMVSKRRDRPYQAGRSKHWIKVKNRKHLAMSRVMESVASNVRSR
jgi:hypothetical protein